jgi:predicted Zn-dependent protease
MNYDFDNAKADLLAKINRGLKYGSSKGVESLELYLANSRSINISIEAGIIAAKQGGIIGVGCRCVADGNKVGFASTSGVTDQRVMLESIKKMIAGIHLSTIKMLVKKESLILLC